MDKLGLYLGCLIPTEQYAYELAIREVLPDLGVELMDVPGLACCGAPLRHINLSLTMYLSARNIAIFEREGLDILAPCPYCHQAISEVKYVLDKNASLKEKVNSYLKEEGLEYRGTNKHYHILDLLHDEIGGKAIKEHIKEPLEGLNIAAHYGCHLIRPNDIPRPDHSENPQKLENLLKVIGAKSDHYNEKLDCCGAHILINESESALTKTGQKLEAVQKHGFDGMTTMCPWGQRMFDSKQDSAGQTVGASLSVPVIYFIQLLGLAMGKDPEVLGLHLNKSPVDKMGKKEED